MGAEISIASRGCEIVEAKKRNEGTASKIGSGPCPIFFNEYL
jgi:hypothetical protein